MGTLFLILTFSGIVLWCILLLPVLEAVLYAAGYQWLALVMFWDHREEFRLQHVWSLTKRPFRAFWARLFGREQGIVETEHYLKRFNYVWRPWFHVRRIPK